jgi:hypothetical protein
MYGIVAVTRAAEARFRASTITSSSIRLSFVGAHNDWSTKTSFPRTFSRISTITSPSLKRPTFARPSGSRRWPTTSCASFRLALPAKTVSLSSATMLPRGFGLGR